MRSDFIWQLMTVMLWEHVGFGAELTYCSVVDVPMHD